MSNCSYCGSPPGYYHGNRCQFFGMKVRASSAAAVPVDALPPPPDLQRFNMRGGLMNPEARGLYVRYEDVQRLLVDRAQQGEPVDEHAAFEAWLARENDTGPIEDWSTFYIWSGGFRAATKAAAPADATQQQEMVVRVAPAPAGQHDAAERALNSLYSAVMNIPCTADAGWGLIAVNHYKFGHRDARHAAADLVAEFASQSRAQRTTIDKKNCRATPAPDTGIPTAGEVEDLKLKLRALVYAASSVIERWESPKWKDEAPTADYIARLREAVNVASSNFRAPVSSTPTSGAVEVPRFKAEVYKANIMADGEGAEEMTGEWYCVDIIDSRRSHVFANGRAIQESYTAYQYKNELDANLRATGLNRFFAAAPHPSEAKAEESQQ